MYILKDCNSGYCLEGCVCVVSDIGSIVLSSLIQNIRNKGGYKNISDVPNTFFDDILKVRGISNCKCNNGTLGILNGLPDSDISLIPNKPLIVDEVVDTVTKPSNGMDKAIQLLKKQVGKPYVWGANGPGSFDCSGLTRYIYKNALGKDIPRVSYDQAKFGTEVSKKDLKEGDLVFFDTMRKGRVSHVGIYIGNNEFIHAANPNDGVIKSKLDGYYEKTYKGARRP